MSIAIENASCVRINENVNDINPNSSHQGNDVSLFLTNSGAGNGNNVVDEEDFSNNEFKDFIKQNGWFGKRFDRFMDVITQLINQFKFNEQFRTIREEITPQDIDKLMPHIKAAYKEFISIDYSVRGKDVEAHLDKLNTTYFIYQGLEDSVRDKIDSAPYTREKKWDTEHYFFDSLRAAQREADMENRH